MDSARGARPAAPGQGGLFEVDEFVGVEQRATEGFTTVGGDEFISNGSLLRCWQALEGNRDGKHSPTASVIQSAGATLAVNFNSENQRQAGIATRGGIPAGYSRP